MNSNELKDLQDKYNRVRMFNVSMEQIGAVSMEASVMSYLKDFTVTSSNFLGSVLKKIKDFITNNHPIKINKTAIYAETHTYDECSKIPLFTITGLDVPLLTYVSKLKEAYGKIDELDTQYIIPLTRYLLEIINNPNLLMSQTHKFNLKMDLDKIKSDLKSMLRGNNRDKSTWGELFSSNNDVIVLKNMIPELYDMVDKRKIESTNSSIENLNSVVKELIALIKDKDELAAGVNMRHANEISASIMDAATYLEFYSLTLIQIRSVFSILEANEKEIDRLK